MFVKICFNYDCETWSCGYSQIMIFEKTPFESLYHMRIETQKLTYGKDERKITPVRHGMTRETVSFFIDSATKMNNDLNYCINNHIVQIDIEKGYKH